MIVLFDRRNAVANVNDDARTLVAEDGGKQALGIGARQCELVGVADAGSFDLDRTSPARGPSSWTVVTSSGLPGAYATAARTSIIGSSVVLRGKRSAAPGPLTPSYELWFVPSRTQTDGSNRLTLLSTSNHDHRYGVVSFTQLGVRG